MRTSPIDSAAACFESESAHPECAVEWWFFQGAYAGPTSGRRDFMATLFRTTLEGADGKAINGFQLMLATLDPDDERGAHHSTTWICPAVLDAAVHRLDADEPHVDEVLERTFRLEIGADGPPHPIRLQPAPQRFDSSPLAIEWQDFALRQSGTEIRLRFRDPGSARTVAMMLTCTQARMDLEYRSAALPPERGGLAYHAYPRTELRGSLDNDEPLVGQAWMDHQWGDKGWLYDADNRIPLGWDWFGINLDGGAHLLVMRHREARTGRITGAFATLADPQGRCRTTTVVELTPRRQWSSAVTFIDYPVAWLIEIPEFDAALFFEPSVDDQELAAFGTMRAVWEGAGVVTGVMRGESVTGPARGEFHGYGYVFDFGDLLAQFAQRVDSGLERFLPRRFDVADVDRLVGPSRWRHDVAAYDTMIAAPAWELLDRGGRRWRPTFGILLMEALGASSRPYEDLVATLELLHAGALIIDDIEDESLLRRGAPCVHRIYGLDVALNVGNTLYFLPGGAILDHPRLDPETRRRCLETKERVCLQAHCGQASDIRWSRQMRPELLQRLQADGDDEILQVYALKTAAAAAGVAEIAAVLAGATAAVTAAVIEFGRTLGVAYQIIDDVHNFSDSPKWTKTVGEDIVNGKVTLVIIDALRRASTTDSERLQEILCSARERERPEVVREGVEVVRASGALDACRARAQAMVQDAWRELSPLLRPSEPKILLRTMCSKLVDIGYGG